MKNSRFHKPLKDLSDRELMEYLFLQNKILYRQLDTIMSYLSEKENPSYTSTLYESFSENGGVEDIDSEIKLQEEYYNSNFVEDK